MILSCSHWRNHPPKPTLQSHWIHPRLSCINHTLHLLQWCQLSAKRRTLRYMGSQLRLLFHRLATALQGQWSSDVRSIWWVGQSLIKLFFFKNLLFMACMVHCFYSIDIACTPHLSYPTTKTTTRAFANAKAAWYALWHCSCPDMPVSWHPKRLDQEGWLKSKKKSACKEHMPNW